MPVLKDDTKAAAIRRALAQRISDGVYAPAERIPTGKEICHEFSVSSVTASLAMAELRSMGLIETRRGAGAFVLPTKPVPVATERLTIGLAYLDILNHTSADQNSSGGAHPLLTLTLAGLRSQFGDRADVLPMAYHKRAFTASDNAVRRAIEEQRVDGLIVEGWLEPEEIDWLIGRTPFVLQGHETYGRAVNTVSENAVMGFQMLIERLCGLRHRHVLYLTYSTEPGIVTHGGRDYVRVGRAAGLSEFSIENILPIPNEEG